MADPTNNQMCGHLQQISATAPSTKLTKVLVMAIGGSAHLASSTAMQAVRTTLMAATPIATIKATPGHLAGPPSAAKFLVDALAHD